MSATILATGIQASGSFGETRSINFSGLASPYDKSRSLMSSAGTKVTSESLPGESDHLTFILPEDPPKEKKKKKKKGKGKGKGKKGGKKKKKKK